MSIEDFLPDPRIQKAEVLKIEGVLISIQSKSFFSNDHIKNSQLFLNWKLCICSKTDALAISNIANNFNSVLHHIFFSWLKIIKGGLLGMKSTFFFDDVLKYEIDSVSISFLTEGVLEEMTFIMLFCWLPKISGKMHLSLIMVFANY